MKTSAITSSLFLVVVTLAVLIYSWSTRNSNEETLRRLDALAARLENVSQAKPSTSMDTLIAQLEQDIVRLDRLMASINWSALARTSHAPPLQAPGQGASRTSISMTLPDTTQNSPVFQISNSPSMSTNWMDELPDSMRSQVEQIFQQHAQSVRMRMGDISQATPEILITSMAESQQELKDRLRAVLSEEQYARFENSLPVLPGMEGK